MLLDLSYYPVNWIEGMKINKDHFVELQNNIEDYLRDSRNLSTNELNFGILPVHSKSAQSLEVMIDSHKELNVTIKNFKAVTPGGGRIEISDAIGDFNQRISIQNFENKEGTFYLILNVDPFNRMTMGTQNMNEIPPRFPHVSSKYYLTTVPVDILHQSNVGALQLPISKFKVGKDGFENDEEFVPPCYTVDGHKVLSDLYTGFDHAMLKLELYCIQIIQKIKYRNNNDTENAIAEMVLKSCEKIVSNVERVITENKWVNTKVTPLQLHINIITFARSLKNCFDSFSGDGKEMLYNYFAEWTDMKSGGYESLFTDIINVEYSALNLFNTSKNCSVFLSKIEALYGILNQLDYIGRKKDTGIFVNENIVKTEKSIFESIDSSGDKKSNETKNSPSFLAE